MNSKKQEIAAGLTEVILKECFVDLVPPDEFAERHQVDVVDICNIIEEAAPKISQRYKLIFRPPNKSEKGKPVPLPTSVPSKKSNLTKEMHKVNKIV